SDGLVEATPDGSDEQFGFDRLEASLARHSAESPQKLRDAVLADVESFTGRQIRDDDLTVLVLRLPAA
ncbi:MAG: SpoIIE family protein phosphatase, partial [Acidobacteriota bacterium]